MAGCVKAGQWVIVSTNGEKRLLKVDAASRVYVGKDRLPAIGLVGMPFGAVVTAENGAVCVDDRLAEDVSGVFAEWASAAEGDEEKRTNKDLFDDGKAQALGQAEIAKLRAQGLQGEEIVREIAQNSATFESKTAFSQHKYLKKKAKKYTPVVQLVKPTPTELCEVYAQSGKLDKIHELRADSLALLIARSCARAGARVLVLDTGTGLVAGALAQRLGGHGSLLMAHARPHVPLDGVHQLNLRDDEWAPIASAPLDDVRNFLEGLAGAEPAAEAATPVAAAGGGEGAPAAAPPGEPEFRSERSGGRSFRRFSPEQTARWLAEGCDTLVIAMHATTPELVQTLIRALRPSGSVVVYNACMSPLVRIAEQLASPSSAVMNVQLCESWAREYQVLPNRTHPVMTNVIPSGFVLSGFARPASDVKR
ncbi:Gcd10p family-domain-containing protein [Pavlovales sp. CCMP2436]|nr:Gcd10p family-domain-containing protein [Pavlovales sp. CCMP2436]